MQFNLPGTGDKLRIFRHIFEKRNVSFDTSYSEFLEGAAHFGCSIRHITAGTDDFAQ